MPGRQLPEDVPGTCQIDTVALSGGDPRESFFWIATLTSPATQWIECAPAWNRGGESTARAMRAIHGRLPFAVRHLHPTTAASSSTDSSSATCGNSSAASISAARARTARTTTAAPGRRTGPSSANISATSGSTATASTPRSRPSAATSALYTNLFRPCKKLVSKELKEGKGVKYRKRHDAPAVPPDRLLRHLPPDDPRVAGHVRQRETVNMVTLRKSIQSQLRKIVHEQSIPPPADRAASVSTHLTDAPVT